MKKILFPTKASFVTILTVISGYTMHVCATAPAYDSATPIKSSRVLFRSGFYGGAHIGTARVNAEIKSDFNYNLARVTDDFNKCHAKKTSLLWGAVVGGRKIFSNKYVLGLNVEADLYQKHAKHDLYYDSGVDIQAAIKKKYVITPAFILGKVLNSQWLAYLKVGPNFTRYKMRLYNPNEGVTSRDAKTKLGMTVGLGAEYAMCSRWSLRGEAIFERSKRYVKGFTDLIADISKEVDTTKTTVNTGSAKLALIYKF